MEADSGAAVFVSLMLFVALAVTVVTVTALIRWFLQRRSTEE